MFAFRFVYISIFVLITLFLQGCAMPVRPLSLDYKTENVDLQKHGVVILSLDMKNNFNPEWPAYKLGALYVPKDPELAKTANLGASYYGGIYGGGERLKPNRSDMVSVLVIPEGEYEMRNITGSSFPGLVGSAINFPVKSNMIKVKAGQGVYLGHLSIVIKARANDTELQTDQLAQRYPWLGQTSFIGQGASGFSKSTPVITYSDRFDLSIKELKADYPALKSLQISNLPINIQLDTVRK